MPPRQLRILSNAPEIERLRDSSRRYAKTLADLIQGYTTEFQSEPAKADYRTSCNAAAAIFKALGQMSIKDNVLHGEERLGTIKKAFEWLKKLESGFRPDPDPRHAQRGPASWDIRMLQKEEPDYELWFKAGVRATTKHTGAFLHAVRMFSEVDRGVKAPALPVENRNKKADAIAVLDPQSTDTAEATPNVDAEAGVEGTPANPKSSTEPADAYSKADTPSPAISEATPDQADSGELNRTEQSPSDDSRIILSSSGWKILRALYENRGNGEPMDRRGLAMAAGLSERTVTKHASALREKAFVQTPEDLGKGYLIAKDGEEAYRSHSAA